MRYWLYELWITVTDWILNSNFPTFLKYETYILFYIVCKELDDEFLDLAQTYEFKAGTTLLLSIIHNGRFTIANIGDSAAMLLKDNGTILRLTDD